MKRCIKLSQALDTAETLLQEILKSTKESPEIQAAASTAINTVKNAKADHLFLFRKIIEN